MLPELAFHGNEEAAVPGERIAICGQTYCQRYDEKEAIGCEHAKSNRENANGPFPLRRPFDY